MRENGPKRKGERLMERQRDSEKETERERRRVEQVGELEPPKAKAP